MVTAAFVDEVKMDDMSLRPNASTGSLGKTYRFYAGRVVWPFGYGLDYTSWTMSWGAGMPPKSVSAAELLAGVSVEVEVTNSGGTAGAKVVQLYVHTPDIPDAPRRTLIAMGKVRLQAGHTAVVTLRTAAVNGTCAFCVYDDSGKGSVPRGTHYELSVGNGGGDAFPLFSIVST